MLTHYSVHAYPLQCACLPLTVCILTQTATGGLFQFLLIPLCLCQGVARAAVHVHHVTCQTPKYCTETHADTHILYIDSCRHPNTVQRPMQTPKYCTETSATCQTHPLTAQRPVPPARHPLTVQKPVPPARHPLIVQKPVPPARHPNIVQRPIATCQTHLNIVQRPMPPARHTPVLYRDHRNSSNTALMREANSPQLMSCQGAQELRSES